MGEIQLMGGGDPESLGHLQGEDAEGTTSEEISELQTYLKQHGAIPLRQPATTEFFPPRKTKSTTSENWSRTFTEC